MPTTYAHDLFGKKIYHELPVEMQTVIRRNVNLYRIGLHGPDILFYHMLKTHKNPYHYYPACGVIPRITYARVIHRAIPKVTSGEILTSLSRMKFITNCMVYDNKGRRKKLLTVISRLAGRKLSDSVMEYFMAKDPVPGSAVPVHNLYGLYEGEVREAPGYLEELFNLSREDRSLSERWHRTYSG